MSVLSVRIGSVIDATPKSGREGSVMPDSSASDSGASDSSASDAGMLEESLVEGAAVHIDEAEAGVVATGAAAGDADSTIGEPGGRAMSLSADDGAVLEELDPAALRRWAFRARAALARHRGGIDALNVFPVPDGDTGTNMLATLTGALRTVRDQLGLPGGAGGGRAVAAEPAQRTGLAGEGPGEEANEPSEAPGQPGENADDMRVEALARKTLLSARGNSGVILSELLRGLAQGLSQMVGSGKARIDGPALAAALRSASERAWQSIGRPVDGTMLSVARAASAAADQAARSGGRLVDVTGAAVEGARRALAATPEQLPPLKRAGVVDAGGAGLLVVLNALHEVVSGRRARPDLTESAGMPHHELAAYTGDVGCAQSAPSAEGSPEFEVMYVVTLATEAEAGSDAAAEQARVRLVDELNAVGDCVVVALDAPAMRVHVHADDIEAVVACGQTIGEVSDMRVERLVTLTALSEAAVPGPAHGSKGGVELVTWLSASIGEHFPGRHVRTAGEFAEVIAAHLVADPQAPPTHVLLVTDQGGATGRGRPNESYEEDPRLHIIRCAHLPAALAALAVYDGSLHSGIVRDLEKDAEPDCGDGLQRAEQEIARSADRTCAAMSLAAAGVRAFEVGPDEMADVGETVTVRLDELLADGGELVTIVLGESASERAAERDSATEMADALEAHLAAHAVEVARIVLPELAPGILLHVGVE